MSDTHHTLHDVMDDLKHRLHDAGHKLSEAGHSLSDMGHATTHKISDLSHTTGHAISNMGHKVGESFQVRHMALCKVCHAELAVEDVAQGCCSDSEGCSCRAFTARCW